jgi:signal transduction histidine kinase
MTSAVEGVVLEREFWTTWPSQEALSRSYRRSTHRWMSLVMRLLILAALFGGTFAQGGFATRHPVAVIASGLLAAGSVVVLVRCTLLNRVAYSVAILLLLLGGAFAARSVQMDFAATVLWCGSAVIGMQRLPLGVAVPLNGIALGAYAAFGTRHGDWATLLATLGLGLVGYVLRLDAESRGSMQRLLRQERAARVAEAETAALRERGRIAREIHDVLAHSLSAQLVHLEAARLLIERGGERDDVLERVVAARRMARQGLAETRQALSALRGEMTSAQEAMTNVRKHARGAKVAVRLQYHTKEVELEVRDFGGRPVDNSGSEPVDNELGVSGSGYGLLGMRERAELLGGTLEAGPVEEGFVVRLRVPA